MKILKYGLLSIIILLGLIVGLGVVNGIIPLGLNIHDEVYQIKNDVAINGYDPVNYFTEGTSSKGISEFSMQWKGANWHFLNKENLTLNYLTNT